ncbi:hypothetical protein GCM10010954_35980 [Halobacillus andaensis]|uniref:DUF2254 domain-containing protein n=1 Tax=Halobacillus andaensis TaxID=1176239 RepID=A0A917EYA8_HALAA|nr:DUF2254 domain-containing protein [Halobacillus andaensis]MBP2006251.1 putative membrane protein [Halobacillus andaensis]GGF33623.1 hypothetical protein GCM10010954_35980 [Halobacillus andaensis]
MFLNLLPVEVRKYFRMSRRQRKHEMQMTLWYMPAIYIFISAFLVAITLVLDLQIGLEGVAPQMLQIEASVTRTLVSTLIGGILTLSAFTLNSLLVVLTTFSGQFSPRMLLNFVSDRQTQHALGIFNGSFVYVLLTFLFIGNASNDTFVATPVMTVTLAFVTAVVFIYFINHATTWMQVHNITYTMKNVSKDIIYHSLRKDLDDHRIEEPGDLKEKDRDKQHTVLARGSGYLQVVDYNKMITEARNDNIIIELHFQVGDYVLAGNEFFSFWGPGANEIEDSKYYEMFEMGHKETEIQDLQMGMHKLAEIAIKAIGNNDPKTASNTIHQMSELMLSVDSYITFSPYLADDQKQVRVILKEETFDYYLYRGFGFIRHYAKNNHLIITDIISSLAKVAESIDISKHDKLWEFACNTMDHIEHEVIYELDKSFLLREVHNLAQVTDHLNEYPEIEEKFYPNANKNT